LTSRSVPPSRSSSVRTGLARRRLSRRLPYSRGFLHPAEVAASVERITGQEAIALLSAIAPNCHALRRDHLHEYGEHADAVVPASCPVVPHRRRSRRRSPVCSRTGALIFRGHHPLRPPSRPKESDFKTGLSLLVGDGRFDSFPSPPTFQISGLRREHAARCRSSGPSENRNRPRPSFRSGESSDGRCQGTRRLPCPNCNGPHGTRDRGHIDSCRLHGPQKRVGNHR